jgi:CRISPR system Cascade subunit CasE
MYLSRIELALSDPGVRAALADGQKLHRLVTGLFDAPRQDVDLLFRLRTQGGAVTLYLYSAVPPVPERLLPCMRLTGSRDLSDWLERMETGMTLGFDLITMPFKKVPDTEGKNSRRRVLRTEEKRIAWLTRKAEQNGFEILSAREQIGEKLRAVHAPDQGGKLYLDTYQYSGMLCITDADAFQNAVRRGIGPGKAYGLGMLLLTR